MYYQGECGENEPAVAALDGMTVGDGETLGLLRDLSHQVPDLSHT